MLSRPSRFPCVLSCPLTLSPFPTMEKENNNIGNNKFKLKFPKFFSSSCITQDISKVTDHQKPIFTPKTPLMKDDDEEEEYVKPSAYPVIREPKQQTPLLSCKPRCPEFVDQMVRESCLIPAAGNPFPRRKLAGRYNLLSPVGDFSGRRCPPVSPASPLFQRDTKKKKKKMTKKQRSKNGDFSNKLDRTHFKSHNPFSFSSSNETDWFSSDDEREEDEEERQTGTLFSSSKSLSFSSKSISLSSDSEPHNRNRIRHQRRRSESKRCPRQVGSKGKEIEVVPLEGKVKDTYAVVKSSSDPYTDFRTSMVEMIIEKQIFGGRELEQLLHCFLSLNSPHHHRVIVEVFTEIWDALFSHRS